jgi:hypothetical protein
MARWVAYQWLNKSQTAYKIFRFKQWLKTGWIAGHLLDC